MSAGYFKIDSGGGYGTDGPPAPADPGGVSRLEAEVRSLENLNRAILDNIQCALVILDEAGTILDCNRRFREIAGTSPDRAITARWEDFVAEEDRARIRGFLKDVSRPIVSQTFRFISSDGVSSYMQANSSTIPGTGDRVVSLADLSEIVKAQHRTAESEDRYRTAVESTRDGILICREETIHFVNSTFCGLTGWSREQTYSMNPLELFPPDDRSRLIAVLGSPGTDGSTVSAPFEVQVLRRDGTVFPVEISPVRINVRGNPAVLLTIHDMTIRKLAEKQLKENHKLFKAIVDNSPVAISLHDRNGTLLMANGAWRSIWGKTEEDQQRLMQPRERLKMDLRDNYLSGYLTQVEKIYREGGELFIPRLRILNPPPDGAEWISHHFYAIEDDRGEVDRVVVLTLDLTEVLKTREQLAESEGQYRELVENIPVAMYRTSVDVAGGRLLSANPEMMKLMGISEQDELAGISVDELYVSSERRGQFLDVVSRGERVENFQAELRRRDGSTFKASLSARGRYDRDGRLSWIEGVVREITETAGSMPASSPSSQ